MTAIERFALQVAGVLLALAAAWFWHVHAVSTARQAGDDAGYARAMAAGETRRAADAETALARERQLRADQRASDDAYIQKENQYAQKLNDAQRRMRAGDDSLHCPAASAVQASAAPADRSVAADAAPDDGGAPIVPAVAGDILGLAADSDGLVRKYDELVIRYDACRAMNNSGTVGSVEP